MADLYLVSCVSQKMDRPGPARQLYCSEWFRKVRDYIEANDYRWLILSAKYYVVAPHRVIHPYNMTLNKMRVSEWRAWAEKVLSQLQLTVRPLDRVVFLAGKRYRELLVDQLNERDVKISVPMAHLKIGEQLSWLKRRCS